MSKKIVILNSLKIYLKKQTQNAIQHTLTGLGISALLIYGVHLFDFTKQGNTIAVILICGLND